MNQTNQIKGSEMSENTFYIPRWPSDSWKKRPGVVIPCSGWDEDQAWRSFDAFITENPDIFTNKTRRSLPKTWRARKAAYLRIGVVMQLAEYKLLS